MIINIIIVIIITIIIFIIISIIIIIIKPLLENKKKIDCHDVFGCLPVDYV